MDESGELRAGGLDGVRPLDHLVQDIRSRLYLIHFPGFHCDYSTAEFSLGIFSILFLLFCDSFFIGPRSVSIMECINYRLINELIFEMPDYGNSSYWVIRKDHKLLIFLIIVLRTCL